jgi:hypothetical protein
MPLPVIAATYRVSIGGAIAGGGRWSNTWHTYETLTGTPTLLQVADMEAQIRSFYVGGIMPFVASATTLDGSDVTPLDGTSGAIHYAYSVAGSGSGDALPPEVAEVLTLRTGARGRRARGRIFLPALTEAAVGALGHLTSTMVTDILADAASMMTALAAINWQIGVASYGLSRRVNYTTTPKTYVDTTWTPFVTGVNSITMDDQLDVMRSRKN